MTRVQFSQQKTLAEAKILKKRHPAGSPLETFGPVGRPLTPPQCLNRRELTSNSHFAKWVGRGGLSTAVWLPFELSIMFHSRRRSRDRPALPIRTLDLP